MKTSILVLLKKKYTGRKFADTNQFRTGGGDNKTKKKKSVPYASLTLDPKPYRDCKIEPNICTACSFHSQFFVNHALTIIMLKQRWREVQNKTDIVRFFIFFEKLYFYHF